MSNNNQLTDQHDEYTYTNRSRIIQQRAASRGGMGLGGGLVGAAIGGLLGRRVGGASGAVIGAVAGALLGKGTAERVNYTVDSLVDAAKSMAETVNDSVSGVGNAVKDTVEQVKPSVVGVGNAVKDTVEQVKPSVVSVVDAVKDTIEEAKPSIVGAVGAVKDTVEEVKPSIVGTVQNLAQVVNNGINDVSNALKDTLDEVKQSVVDVEETAKDADEEVKPFYNHENEIYKHLVTEHLSQSSKQSSFKHKIIQSLSENSQPKDFQVSLPVQPLTPPRALKTGDISSQELGVAQDNIKSPEQIDVSQPITQNLNDLQQSYIEEIDRNDIAHNSVQIKEYQETNPQHQSQNGNILKVSGIILGSLIITLMGVTLGFGRTKNPLVTKSSAYYHPTPKTETKPTIRTEGWIFLGDINKSLDSVSVGNSKLQTQSTDSPVVPTIGSIVNVIVKPGVTLRDNKPQAPRFSHQEQKALSILKPQEKLKILKVELIKAPSTTQSSTKVWAKVSRCGNECL